MIAKELHLTPSTVTRLLDKLEQKGMVRRENKGKNSLVKPTEKSLALNEELMTSWNSLFDNYKKLLGKDFSEKLADQLYDASEKIKNL